MGKPERFYRRWSEADDEYLEEIWGSYPVSVIARKLGRTVTGVKGRAYKLGLGRQTENSEWLPLTTVLEALYGRGIGGVETNRFINAGFPVHVKRFGPKKRAIRGVYIDEMWAWLEEHRSFISFRNFERNLLGREPAWVDDKRRNDADEALRGKRGGHNASWETWEDEKFRRLMKKGITLSDAAAELRKTERALIVRRAYLGIDEHFIRGGNRRWSSADEDVLISMKERGCSWRQIGEELGRGAWACENKYKCLCNPGYKADRKKNGRSGTVKYRGMHSPSECREIQYLASIGALTGFEEVQTL